LSTVRTTFDAGAVSGAAKIELTKKDGETRLRHLYQHNPLRVLFPVPDPGDAALAVLVTTSGGLVAGDRLRIDLRVGPGAIAHVATSAAEKIYRSTGATTQIAQSVSVGEGAWLEYLPHETILFDGAKVRRRTVADVALGGGFLGGNILVFGRRARGERFTYGLLHEQIAVHRGGRLVWADALHLAGAVARLTADPACFDGAAACGTLILVPPRGNPDRFVEAARGDQRLSATPQLRAGVTAINGLAVARWLTDEPAVLRRAFADLACHWRQEAIGLPPRLPRVWHT
jgi:urease accessory protein